MNFLALICIILVEFLGDSINVSGESCSFKGSCLDHNLIRTFVGVLHGCEEGVGEGGVLSGSFFGKLGDFLHFDVHL